MMECTHVYRQKDSSTLEFRIELKPREKVTLTLHFSRLNVR